MKDTLNPTITYEQAVDAHRRYMNMQFKKGGEQPVAHIPAQPDSDTDLVLGGYLRQSREQIESLTRDLAAAREELAAANATVAQCKAAGFIDEQGNVRKVLGTLPLTADGAIVAFGAQVYHPMSVWNGGLHVESAGDGAEVYVPIKKSSDSFVSKSMWTNVSDCYSTPTAPAAAREAKGGV